MLRHIAALHAHPLDVDMLIERLGLGGCGRTPYRRLSGGQQQRLGLAMAVVGRPELVFLDEPTAGLDPQARRGTWELIRELRDSGVTVVFTTHYMDEAERLCDRVGVLHDGRIVTSGRPAELVAARAGAVRVRFSCAEPTVLDGIERAPDVASVSHERGTADVTCSATTVVPLVAELSRRGLAPDDLTIVRPSLEDAFVAITRGNDR
jgi:ABC-2 type transport system ATP-binding protein